MKKKAIFIHGWGGYPDEGWRPWLKDELEKRNFEVINLPMPNTNNPQSDEWVAYLQKTVPSPNQNYYFIGHSLGVITILRYLENLASDLKIGGAILVAGFGYDLEYKGYKGELSSFFKKPINWEKVKSHSNNFIIIHSNDDSWVPLKHNKFLTNRLSGKAIIEHKMKHFSGDDGITKVPVILEEILRISK